MDHEKDQSVREEIIDLARRVSAEHIAPDAQARDQQRAFPWEAIGVLGEVGLMGVGIDERYGGAGGNRLLFASVVTEIAGACASTALVCVSNTVAALI